jgi:hypothetical protein
LNSGLTMRMLRLFFHRKSPTVRIVEGLSLIGITLFFVTQPGWRQWHWFNHLGLGIFVAMYLFVRLCATLRWYPCSHRITTGRQPIGLERHFGRVMVIMTYALALGAVWLWTIGWPPFFWLLDLVLSFFVYMNVVLLYFHAHDRDLTPANLYSLQMTQQ